MPLVVVVALVRARLALLKIDVISESESRKFIWKTVEVFVVVVFVFNLIWPS